jgi:hypothetical protein
VQQRDRPGTQIDVLGRSASASLHRNPARYITVISARYRVPVLDFVEH